MKKLTIPEEIVKLTEMALEGFRVSSEVSKLFEGKTGLKQADPRCTDLFNCELQTIVRKNEIPINGIIYYSTVQSIIFADDLVLITRSQKVLEKIFRRLGGKQKCMGQL